MERKLERRLKNVIAMVLEYARLSVMISLLDVAHAKLKSDMKEPCAMFFLAESDVSQSYNFESVVTLKQYEL